MAMDDLGELELLDPNPDIHELFAHYNSIYFNDSLGACLVSWSSPRMTSCAGTCKYMHGGGCEIRLSEPLLRFRSTADLKNTLLHEMIHAFLWINDKNKEHSEHGSKFQSIMNKINSSSVRDLQRPPGGYNITIYHEFHEEVDNYRVHHWLCESCGDLIKRSMNREPSASDCIENMGRAESCGNSSCHWHRHKMICSGTYTKTAEPPGFKGRPRVTKGMTLKAVSHSPRQTTRRPRPEEGTDSITNAKKSRTITANTNTSKSSPSRKKCKREVEGKELMVVEPNIHDPLVRVPKRGRTSVHRKKALKHKDQCPVVSLWLGYYAVEETDDEIEPLVNKRTERRKKQKLMRQDLKRKAAESEARNGASPSQESSESHDEEGSSYYRLCYGNGRRLRQKKMEIASPVRGDIIDLSDG